MSLTGITFANQKITPSDDGRLYGAMLADGILTGCGITFAAATLSVAAGSLLIGTRELRTSGETLSVTGATSGYARIIIDIDLTRAATKTSFEQAQFQIQYAASLDAFAALEQQDINTAGTHYQAAFCVLSLGTAGITGVVSSLASARVGVAQLTNEARFGTEFAISTPGSTPDLAWGNALVWVWGTSMTIKLTAEVSALLPPNWQTRLLRTTRSPLSGRASARRSTSPRVRRRAPPAPSPCRRRSTSTSKRSITASGSSPALMQAR